MRRPAIYGLCAFVALLICSAAHASIIAQFTGTTPSGSNTTYNYNLLFSTQNGVDRLESGNGTLNPGQIGSADFITLYDVASNGVGGNFVSASAGSGFSVQTQNGGVNASQTLPIDDLNLLNVTYTYNGPTISADTVFLRASRGEFDAVIACYHDQAMIPVKCLSFGEAVNVTLGLPFIRTSVDHGTAFDIAGKGLAEHSSMVAAIELAAKLSTQAGESGRAVEV